MAKPIVAIVGRPNVGKSTFFNKMAGRRVSIVNDMPGVTRDRIYVDAEWCGYAFTLVDTGGIELKSEDQMWKHIRRQAELALDIADVILLFVDGKSGIMADVSMWMNWSLFALIVQKNCLALNLLMYNLIPARKRIWRFNWRC